MEYKLGKSIFLDSCDFFTKKELYNKISHKMEELEEKHTTQYGVPTIEMYVDIFNELKEWLEEQVK